MWGIGALQASGATCVDNATNNRDVAVLRHVVEQRCAGLSEQLNRLAEGLRRLEAMGQALRRQGARTMATAADVMVVDSVLALLVSIQKDPGTLDTVIASVQADKARMEAAILAGTPSAPTA